MASKQKSEVWLHFSPIDAAKKVKCTYCGQQLSVANKSTCGLIRHLKAKHPLQKIERQRQASPEPAAIVDADVDDNENQLQELPQEHPPEQQNRQQRQHQSSTSSRELSTITQYFHKPLPPRKQREIDRQVITMITKEYHPFRIVEEKEFKKLLHMLNPNYKLPTRKTVSHSLIPTMYNETVETVRNRLARASAICLTMDEWSSLNQDSFYAITAHYIVDNDKQTFLTSDLLSCESCDLSHTGENISNRIKHVLSEWGIANKVTGIVTDNASNMKLAIRLGGWRHWGCFAHSLNLATQNGLEEIREVVGKIKKIVKFFHKSNKAAIKLNETLEQMQIPPLKLKNDMPTRWNSTYEMISRVLTVKDALVSTLALLNLGQLVREEGFTQSDMLLTTDEWIIAKQSMDILEMFSIVTTAVSTEKHVSASCAILYYKQLLKHLHSSDNDNLLIPVQNLRKKLISELNKRFGDIERHELISQATLLDPRFKKFGFIDVNNYKNAVQILQKKIATIRVDDNDNATSVEEETAVQTEGATEPKQVKNDMEKLWKDFDAEVKKHVNPADNTASAIIEVDKYLSEPLLPRLDKQGVAQNPLTWWRQRKYIYPRLYQMVIRRLCVMATSVPCERIFSHAGQIVIEKRAKLKTKKISEIIFLNYNLNNTDL